ncbi:hypothetical protein FisN_10Lu199 [Fistulifera solaris]|uniref:Uncharacterized protein n=1 Tax=Fistulifera solaris TaxID=1519565 RepID=A0A1Z5JTG4_FISSO|nr:hypothetical protein FisN_10Lu199 [Fistulifera solaris]|eukprot:GAX17333.1 hypothetical protein FisN_10Lu199 [Fistulifera solaris]
MDYPYACEIELNFPTSSQAEKAVRVMQVDSELSDQVVRTFAFAEPRCMKVRFEATQAKFLRVSVSSFYDYLTVALKCFQEFDPDMDAETS